MKVNQITISKQCTKTILEQLNKSLYKIEYGKEREPIIGFFCHIKYENKNIPVFITNYEAFYLATHKSIKVKTNKETISVELGNIKYFDKDYDLSILQIKENKNTNKIYFLELDENVYKNNNEIHYNNSSIYTIHYNQDKNIYATFGAIKYINKSKMILSTNINLNFKDSPVFNLSNNKLIGIAKENSKYFTNGYFFKFIINEFINEYKISKYSSNDNAWNEIDILVYIEENDINKEIYFLDNDEIFNKGNNIHNNLKELNELNTELYINNIKQQYKKYFIPDKKGIYRIKIKFNAYLTDCSYMFAGCNNITNINFIQFNTKYITNMKGMFLNCSNLKNINLLSFDTKKVVDMSYMFNNCESLHNIPDLSSFDYNFAYKTINKISNFGNLNKIIMRKDKYEILSSNYNNYDLIFKIIVIGDSDSGKSKLINFGIRNIFEDSYNATVGFEFMTFNIKYKDKVIKLQIWDTCGQELYRSLITNFYRNTSLAIIVYAINNKDTFNSIDDWLLECRQHSSPDAKLILVGNKIGIDEEE